MKKLLFIALPLILLIAGLESTAKVACDRKVVAGIRANYQHPGPSTTLHGHPFLQFTRHPDSPGNNLRGFSDDEFIFDDDCIKIAAFGGSTTAGNDAWPDSLEKLLNKKGEGCYYVLNFGVQGYTTAHSLAALVHIAVEYDLDYAIVHHGYNDIIPARIEGFKGDFSHVYKPFTMTLVKNTNPLHLWLIHHSVLYVNLWHLAGKEKPGQRNHDPMYRAGTSCNPDYYKTCKAVKRNLHTFDSVCQGYGIQMILVGTPFDPDAVLPIEIKGFAKMNQCFREFAAGYPGIRFYDMQRNSNLLKEHYTDGYHVNHAGQELKARMIFDFITSW